MKRAIAKTKQQGYNTMYLNANPIGTQGLNLNDLKGFYESFGFKEALHQGGNIQMIKHLNESNPIDETTNPMDKLWKIGGVILIKGMKQEDGTQRLYVTTTRNILGLDRKKVDNTAGKAATMAVLGNQIYRLSIVDGKLKAQGVAWNTEASMLKQLGLTRMGVALNNNKTPLHWETLKHNNIAMAINANSGQILGLPNIKWVG
jgi:hypothetical protein